VRSFYKKYVVIYFMNFFFMFLFSKSVFYYVFLFHKHNLDSYFLKKDNKLIYKENVEIMNMRNIKAEE
jgi:hypothetical protein